MIRKYSPLFAGPVLLLLFLATGWLLNPSGGEEGERSLYELASDLSRREAKLDATREMLASMDEYLGIDAEGAPEEPVRFDPAARFRPLLEEFDPAADSWRELEPPGEGRYAFEMRSSFRRILAFLHKVDCAGPGSVVESMKLEGEGDRVRLSVVIAPAGERAGS